MTEPLFHFRQFSLRQEHSAMRITTDGVLLGAWADCEGAGTILDIGAGTGLIALMIAQRCDGTITAVEPDKGSFEDLQYNIFHSPWRERIIPVNRTLQTFARESGAGGAFDLIVSNPPFFSGDKLPEQSGKRDTRHTVMLTHETLITLVSLLLKRGGRFLLILPARYEQEIIALAAVQRLFCNRVLRVIPRQGKAVNRVLLEFGREKRPLQADRLTIHDGDDYSDSYKALTRAYYPAF
jgi:tRNA1Val (adenine37-N6)-methyltransferase